MWCLFLFSLFDKKQIMISIAYHLTLFGKIDANSATQVTKRTLSDIDLSIGVYTKIIVAGVACC
ncbi:hypothetical protein VcTj87_12320 [Vibrio comitans]